MSLLPCKLCRNVSDEVFADMAYCDTLGHGRVTPSADPLSSQMHEMATLVRIVRNGVNKIFVYFFNGVNSWPVESDFPLWLQLDKEMSWMQDKLASTKLSIRFLLLVLFMQS